MGSKRDGLEQDLNSQLLSAMDWCLKVSRYWARNECVIMVTVLEFMHFFNFSYNIASGFWVCNFEFSMSANYKYASEEVNQLESSGTWDMYTYVYLCGWRLVITSTSLCLWHINNSLVNRQFNNDAMYHVGLLFSKCQFNNNRLFIIEVT